MEIVLPTIGKLDCSVSDGRFFLCNRECHTPEEHKSFLKELELIPDLELGALYLAPYADLKEASFMGVNFSILYDLDYNFCTLSFAEKDKPIGELLAQKLR